MFQYNTIPSPPPQPIPARWPLLSNTKRRYINSHTRHTTPPTRPYDHQLLTV